MKYSLCTPPVYLRDLLWVPRYLEGVLCKWSEWVYVFMQARHLVGCLFRYSQKQSSDSFTALTATTLKCIGRLMAWMCRTFLRDYILESHLVLLCKDITCSNIVCTARTDAFAGEMQPIWSFWLSTSLCLVQHQSGSKLTMVMSSECQSNNSSVQKILLFILLIQQQHLSGNCNVICTTSLTYDSN